MSTDAENTLGRALIYNYLPLRQLMQDSPITNVETVFCLL